VCVRVRVCVCVNTDVDTAQSGWDAVDAAVVQWLAGAGHCSSLWVVVVSPVRCVHSVSYTCILWRPISVCDCDIYLTSVKLLFVDIVLK